MAEATIGALANLATVTAVDRCVVATLTEANARLVKQLEDNSNELQELKDLIKKERFEKCVQGSVILISWYPNAIGIRTKSGRRTVAKAQTRRTQVFDACVLVTPL
jgi:hypothetical protein